MGEAEGKRAAVQAAGGIVIRDAQAPRIAVVRLRKDNSWVLPKGKLKPGEDALAAARREVVEETGHEVSVHEFLGEMEDETRDRPKVVQFWRMQADSAQTHELATDIRAVKWLPLADAVERLSRPHEKAFLSRLGPDVIAAAQHAELPEPSIRETPPSWIEGLLGWLKRRMQWLVKTSP